MNALFARARHVLREHPRHAALGATTVGLVVGPRWPGALLPLTAACALLAAGVWRPIAAVALGACLAAAGTAGAARLHALDRTVLPPAFERTITVDVTLQQAPQPLGHGAAYAIARLGGELVELRGPRSVPWPRGADPGDVVAVRGHLRALGPFEDYLRARSVHAGLTAESIVATGRRRGGAMGAVDGVRHRAERGLGDGLPPRLAALWRGMVLGQAPPDRDLAGDFTTSGLSHLVVASGENIVLLSALAIGLCALVGVPLRARYPIVLGLIALYVPLAGGGASIQRAGIMGAAATVAAAAGRPSQRAYALLLAATVTLALNPRADADVGWQLSFAAVAAIATLAAPLRRRLVRRHVPGLLAEATAVTTAATIGTAPLIAAHFGQFQLVSLPANVLAAPAVAPIMWLGVLAGALAQVSATLAVPLNAVASVPLAYLVALAHAAAGVPHATVGAGVVPVTVGCFVCAGAILRRRRG